MSVMVKLCSNSDSDSDSDSNSNSNSKSNSNGNICNTSSIICSNSNIS